MSVASVMVMNGVVVCKMMCEDCGGCREGRLMKVMDEEERLREIYEGKGEEELQMMKILEDEIRSVVRSWMKILKWLKREFFPDFLVILLQIEE